MTMTYKTLAQLAPSGTSLTDLYTCPTATNTLLSRILICNRTATPTTCTVTIAPLGAADAAPHSIAFALPVGPNETIGIDLSAGLIATDKVRVATGTANALAFNLFGVEIT